MATAESIYFGCPVLAYATGGATDLVVHGMNGILLGEREVRLWARTIQAIFDTGQVSRLRAEVRNFSNSMTWESRGLAYVRVYEEVIQHWLHKRRSH